jgi:hypothetical protein
MLLGVSHVRFADAKKKVDVTEEMYFVAPMTNDPIPVNWENAKQVSMSMSDLASTPPEGVALSELPPTASSPKSYVGWRRDFSNWLARTQTLDLMSGPSLK